jgi:putative ABC transport system permease protein
LVGIWSDIRLGLRSLRKNLAFTTFGVLTIALGIGVNTAMFGLIANVLLRPLPVVKPSELVAIGSASTSTSPAKPGISWESYLEYRDNSSPSFEGLAAYNEGMPVSISPANGREISADAAVVTGNYFEVLGVRAYGGRLISAQDDDSNVAVLSYRTWRELYGGRIDALGSTLRLAGNLYAVVGITPPDFTGISLDSTPDVWIPMSPMIHGNTLVAGMAKSIDSTWFKGVGRLRRTVTLGQARQQLIAAAFQLGAGKTFNIGANWEKPRPSLDLLENSRGGTSSASALLLFGAIAFLLLLVVCDIASMLLARFERRRKEVAIRLALGASKVRVIRAVVVEGWLLSLFGAIAGMVVAYWSLKFIVVLLPPQMQWHKSLLTSFLEGRALIFTVAVTVFAGLFFSLAPAIRAARLNTLSVINSDAAVASSGKPRAAFRGGLTVFQTAVSVLLLGITLLFFKTYWNESHLHLSYNPHGGYIYGLEGWRTSKDENANQTFLANVLQTVKAAPGVEYAALTTNPLLVGKVGMPADYYFQWCRVSPGYFDAMGLTLLRGRDFNFDDRKGAPPVAIVNLKMAERFFAGKNPVGQHLPHVLGDLHSVEVVEIVGVVADTLVRRGPSEDDALLYMPLAQQLDSNPLGFRLSLLIRSKSSPSGQLAVKAAVDRIGAGLSLTGPTSFQEALGSRFSSELVRAELFGGLAILAMLLTACGLFGLVSYITAARTRELGLRLAIGASRLSIMRLILRDGIVLTFVGVGIGLGCEFGLMRFLSSFVRGIEPLDAPASAIVALILSGVGLVASSIPAWRASRLNPIIALRNN